MDINEILSSLSEDDISKLKDAAKTMLSSENQTDEQPKIADSTISGLLGKLTGTKETEDTGTALLKALKPLLSEQRQQKADEALKILKLTELLPLLKNTGLLKDLL